MLMEEELKFDAHKAKKCSFTTSRPLIWAKTIEYHLQEALNPYYSSKYSSSDGHYIEYALYYKHSKEKKVTINIYVKTGVVLIHGEHFQFWAEKVFPLLRHQVEKQVLSPTFTDVGNLWNENVTLKSSLRDVEKDYNSIAEQLDSVQLKSSELRRALQTVDGVKACTVPGCKRHGETEAEVAPDSFINLEDQISEIRARLRRKISEIKYMTNDSPASVCKHEVWADLAKIQCHIEAVQQSILRDITKLKSRMDAIDLTFDSMSRFTGNAATLRKIEREQSNLNVNMESINKSIDEMKRKIRMAWYDYRA